MMMVGTLQVNALILFSTVNFKPVLASPQSKETRAAHHETNNYQWCPVLLDGCDVVKR